MISIRLISSFDSFDNAPFKLPNSICVSNGVITLADGGNDRVVVLGNDCFSLGSTGIGRYRFKEPVFAYSREKYLYVCDWYNHRVIEYKNKVFIRQFGVYGNKSHRKWSWIVRLVRSWASNGSYIKSHFIDNQRSKESGRYNLTLSSGLRSLLYYTRNISFLVNSLKRSIYIDKPNACCIAGNRLYVSQKNNRSITVISLDSGDKIAELSAVNGAEFGRLGQMSIFDDLVYLCDETNSCVWIFNKELLFLDKMFLPGLGVFSIDVDENYIVVCGATEFRIYNRNKLLLLQHTAEAEYHGISLDGGSLYLCDRYNSRIECYEISSGLPNE